MERGVPKTAQAVRWCIDSLKSLVACASPDHVFVVQMTCEYPSLYRGLMWPTSFTCHFIAGNVSTEERPGDHDH